MSVLGALAGAAVSGLWRTAAILLAGLLLATAGGAGSALWLLRNDLAQARNQAAMALERAAEYQTAIREQNRATEVLARETAAARARGVAAQQQAAAAGRRYDQAMQQLTGAGVRITTCDEAMPFVNKLLEDAR